MIELKLNIFINSMQEIIGVYKEEGRHVLERRFVLSGYIVNTHKELKFDWQIPGETLNDKRKIFNALIDYLTTTNGDELNEVVMIIEIEEITKDDKDKYSIRLLNDFNHLLKIKELYTSQGKNVNELLEKKVTINEEEQIDDIIIDNTKVNEKEDNRNEQPYVLTSEIESEDNNTIDDTENIEETTEEHIDQDNSNIVEEIKQINNTDVNENENVPPENNTDIKNTIEETEQVSTVKTDVIADETEHTEENIITEDSEPEKTLKQLYEAIQHRDDFNSTALNNFVDKAVPVDSEIKNLLKVIVLNSTMIKDSYKTFLNKFNKLQSMGTRNEIILFTQFNGYGISNRYVKMKYIDVMNNLKEKYEIGAIEQGIQQVYSKFVEMESEENKND